MVNPFKYPTVIYPTVIRGYIEGPIRLESMDGSEIYIPERNLNKFGPIWIEGKQYGVTHLQKMSKKGWLLMSPYIFHWWDFTKLQEKDLNGNWIPGSEEGWYSRTPGWRWDVAGTKGKHWILSKGYIGKHWD